MTINDPAAFCAGLWDWSILDGCFGDTKIKPTDIDGVVERNGNFLVFETKAIGAHVPQGQQITLRRMVSTGFFTVIIVWGNTNQPSKAMLYTKQKEIEYDPCSLDKFREVVSKWFAYANK